MIDSPGGQCCIDTSMMCRAGSKDDSNKEYAAAPAHMAYSTDGDVCKTPVRAVKAAAGPQDSGCPHIDKQVLHLPM